MAAALSPRGVTRKHPLNILSENVELEVYQAASFSTAKVGVTFCIGDDPDRETSRRNLSDSQANAVDGYRSFASDVTRKLGR